MPSEERSRKMPTQESITTEIMSEITRTEGRHSVFEDQVRKMPIPICSVFLGKEGKIVPVRFRDTDTELPVKDPEGLKKVFPRTLA
ncbi:MAG: hypothetical protein GX422_04715, partial [Deltaproteobacteria bacterium]|nr:hypothetical protein [Deltaproteobacteria bacterium]